MYLNARESRALSRLFGLLAEDLAEQEIREGVGHWLLELLSADYFASFVWDDRTRAFSRRVSLNMNDSTLATYDAYYQFHDPITLKLQARRAPTLVTQVMPQRELMRTEFFNDFLARDGLHWGVNVYAYVGDENLGDLRIWRGRQRENFDAHTLSLLRLVEPAFTGALLRARTATPSPAADRGSVPDESDPRSVARGPGGGPMPRESLALVQPDAVALLSVREYSVARMIADGCTDKEIARRLGVEPSTVRTYVKRIFTKLGVYRRGGVAALIGRP